MPTAKPCDRKRVLVALVLRSHYRARLQTDFDLGDALRLLHSQVDGIDGVPRPDSFGVGQFALSGRDLVALDAVQRFEVLRGPASTLYGSKALAGVVAFATRTPEDFLWRGNSLSTGGSLGFSSYCHQPMQLVRSANRPSCCSLIRFSISPRWQ